MTDDDLLALCVLEEAGAEVDDGKAAVARVIFNRMRLKYSSDGTIAGTVMKYDQFSWAWFSFVNGHYTRVADTVEQATAIAERKLAAALPGAIANCGRIAQEVQAGTYHGPLYDKLTDDAVLYLNPHILHRLPSWATPDKLVCVIERHFFYHA